MIYGKTDIKEYFKKAGRKYFAIYSKGTVDRGNPIYKTDDEADTNTDDAFRNFEEVLTWLKTGEYTLLLNDNAKVSTRGNLRTDFRISMDDSLANQAKEAVQGIGNIAGPIDYETMMAKASVMAKNEFQKLMDQKELEDAKAKVIDLQKRVDEAEKAVQDPWNKFIGALAPHADGLVGSLMGKPAAPQLSTAIAGITPDLHLDENCTEGEINAHAQKVFEDFAGALQAAKPNEWLQILVKLTDLIKNNPKKFDMALTFL